MAIIVVLLGFYLCIKLLLILAYIRNRYLMGCDVMCSRVLRGD